MATFHIETDRQSYLPGDNIEGRVLVNIPASISNTQGITLKFMGFQSIKSQEKVETISAKFANPLEQNVQANNLQKKGQLQAYHVHESADLSVSQCHSEEKKKQDLRPKYIKTPQDKYFELKYQQKSSQISKGIVQLMPSGKILAGQYCFPFSFPTNSKWPPSFKQESPQLKANIKYYLAVTLEPFTPRFQFKSTKEIIFCDRESSKKINQFQSEVSSLYCFKKGRTEVRASLDKDGYYPNDNGQVILQIDNSHCEVDIQSLQVALKYAQTLKIGDAAQKKSDLFKKQLNCVTKAGQSVLGSNSIKVPFTMPTTPSTCRGQNISSSYTLQIQLKHDALLYKDEIYNIPFTVYPSLTKSEIPWDMRGKWQPKTMGISKLIVSNVETGEKQVKNLK